MNELKINKIFLSEMPWTPNPKKQKIVIDKQATEVCNMKDIKEYTSNLNHTDTIEASDIIWIDPDCDVPLRDFKKNYKNLITKDITKATCVVINKADLNYNDDYSSEYTYCNNDTWTMDEDVVNVIGTSQVEKFVDVRYFDKFNTLCEIKDKKVVNPINLLIGKGELSDELALKLDSLINSEDKEMHELGLKMLTTINISKNVERIASIIINSEDFSRRYKGSRFIVSCIEDNIPDFIRRGNSSALVFFLKMLVKNPNDSIITKKFNDFIKDKYLSEDDKLPDITIRTI